MLAHCHAGCEQQAVVDALRRLGLWPGKHFFREEVTEEVHRHCQNQPVGGPRSLAIAPPPIIKNPLSKPSNKVAFMAFIFTLLYGLLDQDLAGRAYSWTSLKTTPLADRFINILVTSCPNPGQSIRTLDQTSLHSTLEAILRLIGPYSIGYDLAGESWRVGFSFSAPIVGSGLSTASKPTESWHWLKPRVAQKQIHRLAPRPRPRAPRAIDYWERGRRVIRAVDRSRPHCSSIRPVSGGHRHSRLRSVSIARWNSATRWQE